MFYCGTATDTQAPLNLKERDVKHTRIDDIYTLYGLYEFKEEIGHGSFGTVVAAVEKQNSRKWAIKIVNKFVAGQKILDELQREIKILKYVSHPNIIYLDRIYESPKKIYMVLELCKTEFYQIYRKQKPFSEKVCKKVLKQLVNAVVYLHKHDIVHRDIKMENILVVDNPTDPQDEYFIKLSDFGLSVIKTGSGLSGMLKDYCGTIIYMPPEILSMKAYSELCDVWALGIILYAMLYGQFPFRSSKENLLIKTICNNEPSFMNDTLISNEVIDLLKQILSKDPVKRITALQVKEHPWLMEKRGKNRKEENIIEMMKQWKSDLRVANTVVAADSESDWVSAIFEYPDVQSGSIVSGIE